MGILPTLKVFLESAEKAILAVSMCPSLDATPSVPYWAVKIGCPTRLSATSFAHAAYARML